AEADEIEALHPLPDGPWIFSRAVLSTAAGVCHHRTRTPEPKAPRGIASRSAKPVLFNDIDRWVLRCALVVPTPSLAFSPRIVEAHEPMCVQTFRSEFAIERFDESIVSRRAGSGGATIGNRPRSRTRPGRWTLSMIRLRPDASCGYSR